MIICYIFHPLKCDSHLQKAWRNVLRHIVASNNCFNNCNKKFFIKNSKSDLSCTQRSLSIGTSIKSVNRLGAPPISIEWSDVTSMGYNRDFPVCIITRAYIYKYKLWTKNSNAELNSKDCQDSNVVQKVELACFVSPPIVNKLKDYFAGDDSIWSTPGDGNKVAFLLHLMHRRACNYALSSSLTSPTLWSLYSLYYGSISLHLLPSA